MGFGDLIGSETARLIAAGRNGSEDFATIIDTGFGIVQRQTT